MISASSLPRLSVCPASESMPHEDYNTVHAEAGTERHAEREGHVNAGRLDELPDEVRALIPTGSIVAAEVAVAYDLATGTARRLGLGLKRDYQVTPDEVPGTIDLLILNGRHAIIVDYKGHAETDAWLQVMHHALCVSRIHDTDDVTVALRYESGWMPVRQLDVFEIDAFASELAAIVEATRNPPQPVPSEHCAFCPAYHSCPESEKLATQVKDDTLWTRVEAANLNDDEIAADFYALWQKVKLLSTRMGAKLYARAKDRPIPLGNGKAFMRRVTEGNRKLDGKKGHAIIAARYGKSIADAAVELSLTQKQLEEALKFADLGGVSRTRAKEEIIAALDEAGGVSRKPGETYEEAPLKLAAGDEAA